MNPDELTATAGLILAGGRSSRMGQNKALLQLQGQTLVSRALARLQPQVQAVAISSNQTLPDHRGTPCLEDAISGYPGPLAGVLRGLSWMREQLPGCRWLATVAVDTPFFPFDLVASLHAARAADSLLVCARSDGRLHPTLSLWHINLQQPLRQFLEIEHGRRMMDFMTRERATAADFESGTADPFFNINTVADMQKAAAILSAQAEHPSPSNPLTR